jgi:hypothetical protein
MSVAGSRATFAFGTKRTNSVRRPDVSYRPKADMRQSAHVSLVSGTVVSTLPLNLFGLQLVHLRELCAGAIVNTQ